MQLVTKNMKKREPYSRNAQLHPAPQYEIQLEE